MQPKVLALTVLLAACAPLSERQISDLTRWSATAANHCASAGKCPGPAACVDATVAALQLLGTYSAASSACEPYK